jgi:hypothetical protein
MLNEFLTIIFYVVIIRMVLLFFKKDRPEPSEEINTFFWNVILSTIFYLIIKFLFY